MLKERPDHIDVAMIFLPDFLYNSFLFLTFAIKYRRCVVNGASQDGVPECRVVV